MDLSVNSHSLTLGGVWCPEDITFISALRKKFVRQVPASLKSSMITLLCRLDLMVGTEANQLENLDAIGTTESWSG